MLPIDLTDEERIIVDGLQMLAKVAHRNAVEAGWYTDPKTGQPIERNKGEMIALMHSELSEALEGVRKNIPDDKLPHRPATEVEFADLEIRLADFVGKFKPDVAGAVIEKMRFNKTREDHKLENRLKAGGKAF